MTKISLAELPTFIHVLIDSQKTYTQSITDLGRKWKNCEELSSCWCESSSCSFVIKVHNHSKPKLGKHYVTKLNKSAMGTFDRYFMN